MAARNAKPSVLSLSSVNLSILGNESWAGKFPVYTRWSSWFAFRPGLAYSLFPQRTIFVVYIRESGLVHLPRSPLEQPMGSRQGSSPTTHKHNENVLRYVTGDFFIIPLTLQRFLIYSIVPSVCWQKIQRLGLNSMTKHVKNTRGG